MSIPTSLRLPPQVVDPFRVQIEIVNPELEVGEPLQIRCGFTLLHYLYGGRMQLTWDLSHDLTVLVQYPGRPPIRVRNPLERVFAPGTTIDFDPGETRWLEAHALYLPQAFSGLLFEQPGTYGVTVQVKFKSPKGDGVVVTSPLVPVKVKPPGAASKRAIDFLNSFSDVDQERALVRDLQTLIPTPETRPQIVKLLEAAPDSTLSPYGLYALADEARANNRFADILAPAQQIVDRFPGHPLADDAQILIAFAHENLGHPQEAADAVRHTFLQDPESNRIRRKYDIFTKFLEPMLHPADPSSWMLFDAGRAPTIQEWNRMIGYTPVEQVRAPEEGPPAPQGLPQPTPVNVLLDPTLGAE